jgi:hypothetical protein
MFELKRLSIAAIPAALAKAEHYRLLNEPEEAQSICEDVLRVDPSNRAALVTLILALTDTFSRGEAGVVTRARELVATLGAEYERAYYSGVVAERRARALIDRGGPGRFVAAGDWLREAMRAFERADAVKPVDQDDALLRWNACVRLFHQYPEMMEAGNDRNGPVVLE